VQRDRVDQTGSTASDAGKVPAPLVIQAPEQQDRQGQVRREKGGTLWAGVSSVRSVMAGVRRLDLHRSLVLLQVPQHMSQRAQRTERQRYCKQVCQQMTLSTGSE